MSRKKQQGAETVEFAIVAALLFFVLFAIIEFSMVLYNQAIITAGSREVAREFSVYRIETNPGAGADNFLRPIRPTDADINAALTDFFDRFPLISLGGASVPVLNGNHDGTTGGGDAVEVAPDYTYNFLILQPLSALLGGALTGDVNLSATSVMRYEYEHVGVDAWN